MSVPTYRDALCGETIFRFRPLKSFPRKSTKFLSIRHFSSAISLPGNQPTTRTNDCVHHAVNRFVDAIDSHFSCNPLLNRDCGSLFEVRSAREKVLSRKNMSPSLEDTLPTRTCIPGVSPTEGGVCRRSVVISARLGVLTLCSI